mmetsp:Transcript_21089/g.45689  ORF Transcript_21089/g.45689 Transcript_21089/m.45689 type:complete len:220 (-) Transcript_21089:825-1484(-)
MCLGSSWTANKAIWTSVSVASSLFVATLAKGCLGAIVVVALDVGGIVLVVETFGTEEGQAIPFVGATFHVVPGCGALILLAHVTLEVCSQHLRGETSIGVARHGVDAASRSVLGYRAGCPVTGQQVRVVSQDHAIGALQGRASSLFGTTLLERGAVASSVVAEDILSIRFLDVLVGALVHGALSFFAAASVLVPHRMTTWPSAIDEGAVVLGDEMLWAS